MKFQNYFRLLMLVLPFISFAYYKDVNGVRVWVDPDVTDTIKNEAKAPIQTTSPKKQSTQKPQAPQYSAELRSAIKWLYDNGLTKFNEPEKFRPYDKITRQQAAKMFSVLAEDIYGYVHWEELATCRFLDTTTFDPTLSEHIIKSCKQEIFKGFNGKFDPDRNLSNAEAATVMTRILTYIKDAGGEQRYKNYFNYTLDNGLTKGLRMGSDKLVYDRASRGEVAIMIYRAINAGLAKDLSCKSPWGTKVENGLYVTAYKNSTEKYNNQCVEEKRYCVNGTLDGLFINQTCNNLAPKTCSLPRGGTIEHGQSVDSYSSQQVAYGQTCSKSTRTCNNGNLEGSYSSQYASCKVESPKTCKTPWGEDVYHGNTVKGYKKQTIAYSSSDTCDANSVSATCNNGKLDMSSSYQYSQCTKDSAKSCDLPWGGTIQHGSSVSAFMQTGVNFGQTCSTSKTRSCDNGLLLGDTQYKYQSCSVKEAASCTTPWGLTVNHNSSVSAYNQQSVAYGQVCNTPQTKSCLNGVLSFSQGYVYSGCIVAEAASCTTPWGSSVAHGTVVNAYSQASVAYTRTCSAPQTKTCNNGVLGFSSTYKFESCKVNGPASCTTPRGSVVEHGTVVSGYNQSTVPFGQNCNSPQVKTCNNGVLGFSSTYKYGSCTVSAPLNCSIGTRTIAHGETVQAFNVQFATVNTNTCPASIARTCTNGVLNGSSSYIHQSCHLGCQTPRNSFLQHGSSVTAFETNISTTGATCVSELRACANGVLGGSFIYQTCN